MHRQGGSAWMGTDDELDSTFVLYSADGRPVLSERRWMCDELKQQLKSARGVVCCSCCSAPTALSTGAAACVAHSAAPMALHGCYRVALHGCPVANCCSVLTSNMCHGCQAQFVFVFSCWCLSRGGTHTVCIGSQLCSALCLPSRVSAIGR